MATMTTAPEVRRIVDAIASRRRFVISSHSRPDGDSIGSSLAMAYALRAMGKVADVVHADRAPVPLLQFPGVPEIRIAADVDGDYDATIVMECGDLERTGVAGLDRFFVINIDHHPGNTGYGQLQWFDPTAAACGEMVFDLIKALGVPLSLEIATHIYLAILTDTGSFHYSNITPRTFDICRQCMEAGVSPPAVARSIFDANNLGRLKLFGAVLNRMHLDATGRIATLSVDKQLTHDCGGTYEDTEGLINLPLTVKEILAVVFFKEIGPGDWRVSMRSKGNIDINAIAKEFGGGGHKNASGCSAQGDLETLQAVFQQKITRAIDD
jgi:phosphoesterase RecJ-like protein